MLLTSCTTCPKREDKISFPTIPDPVTEDGNAIYAPLPFFDSNDIFLIKTSDENTVIPTNIWNSIYKGKDIVIVEKWYWTQLMYYLIDTDAAIERYNLNFE
jgi:hypothetical protein